jgi:toxin ParE1/3/4
MDYKIIISPKAQIEIEDISEYYSQINFTILTKFYSELENAYKYLETNPHFQTRYKNYRAIPIKKFPYLLFFVIDETTKTIKVLSCFNTSRSPKNYPK